ncbi:MAG: GNAT family N-acetyltransferase [Marinoscillum sp.]
MNAPSPTDLTVRILEFDAQYAPDFARLNYEWLNQYFEVEPHDREMLDAPQQYIIDKGGQIFFAALGEEIVGTAALIVETPDTYELAKMGVTNKYRGLKIGKKLIHHAIAYSRIKGMHSVVLESNTKLTPAINLYIQTGFKAAPLNECSPYARCNIRMELVL